MNIFQRIWVQISKSIARVVWKKRGILDENDHQKIKELLIPDYYIIATRRNNHLSTYAISLGNFLLTGRFSYWAHVMMNLEDEVHNDDDFRIIEAIGSGVQITPFDRAFDVHAVALLKPKNMSIEHWTSVLDNAKLELGKPYDNLFDIKRDNALSCVELVRIALMRGDPEYHKNFKNFEKMISKKKNLTPQMFYDCEDFEVVFEIKK